MGKPLRVLIVEDSEDDALLEIRALKSGDYDPKYERVETAGAIRTALREKTWDVILCDYQMPKFNGLDAITLLKETGIDIPLIIVSGAIGEETAADCMRFGAHDYIMKGNLSRLVHAIERELQAAESRRQSKRYENEIKELGLSNQRILNAAGDGIFGLNSKGEITFINPAAAQMLGYDNQELIGKVSHDTFHHTRPDGSRYAREDCPIYKDFKDGISNYQKSDMFICKDGAALPIEYTSSPIVDDGNLIGGVVAFRDITERRRQEKQLQGALESLRKALGTTIQVMVSAVEIRDPYTAGHQTRSAALAGAIAAEMGLSQENIDGIRMAGSIHDIGKLSIPAEILSKPTTLSEIELLLIKEHANRGYEILKDVESPWPLAEIVHQHHERMDGSGYPGNLKGEEILIEARILAVSDVVEAMASHRPYRPALGVDTALNEIEKNSGIFYDKTVAAACLRLFREKGYKLAGS
jgi:PAS domain S-box-containing protein